MNDTKTTDPLEGIEPSAYQCREHGQDDWHICSKEGFGLNTFRYVYRKLYAPDAIRALGAKTTTQQPD
jgi:hypothetical protein